LVWKVSYREELQAEFKTSLRWMAAGWCSGLLAATYVLVHDVLLKRVNGPGEVGLADLFFLGSYPLTLIGLFRLPRAAGPLPGRWRIILDSAVFIFGVGIPLWVFALNPALGHSPGLDVFVSMAYTGLAFLGVIAVDFVLLRCVPHPGPRGFNLVLAGITLSWASDLIFSLGVTQQLRIPDPFHLTNLITGLSLVLILLGAQWLRSDPVPATPSRPAAFSPVPMFTLVVVALWLAGFLNVTIVSRGAIQGILAGIIGLLFILLLREGLAARDSVRQATEAVTATLRARFEALVQHSSDLILVVDHEGRCLFSSPAASRFFGVKGQGPEGQSLSVFIHPEDLEPWAAFFTALQSRPDARPVRQLRTQGPEGEWRLLEISGSNLLANPDVGGLVLNARDITDRHQLENQLRQVMKMEALGRLAGGVSHDFNNLLCAILGNVELAKMNLPADDPLHARLSRIEGAASRGAALTGRLLSFTRQDSALTTILGQAQVLEGLRQLIEGLLGEQIHLEMPLETGPGCFQGNLGDVEQGLLNLVINARDAMPTGGLITVSARDGELSDPGQMTFLAPNPGPYVVLEVSDTGTGMDAGILSHLFEPFFTTKGKEKGSGLGLIGVYGMLKAANGGIFVRSEPGLGTTFQLWFPRVAAALQNDPKLPQTESIHGSETLLLVEDEEGVREAAKEVLDSLGYRVFVAGNANQARAFLKGYDGELHMLVTDVIMPGDSGPKLAAELLKARPDLRVLYISGYTAGELVAQGLGHPGNLLLEKPFRREELGRRIREILGDPAGLC
jgi:PAS domain S-box-containing protein